MLRCKRKENKTKLFCWSSNLPTHTTPTRYEPKHKSVRFCCFTLGQPKWRASKGFHHYESCPRSAISIWVGCKPRLFGGTEAPCDTTWYMVQDTVNILSNHWVWDQADLASTFWKRRMCPNPLKCKFQANLRQIKRTLFHTADPILWAPGEIQRVPETALRMFMNYSHI